MSRLLDINALKPQCQEKGRLYNAKVIERDAMNDTIASLLAEVNACEYDGPVVTEEVESPTPTP
jgi:hypothetical protein